MTLDWGPRPGVVINIAVGADRRSTANRRARRLRDARPALPLAVRAPVQLRAHVRPSRRVDLVGSLHGRPVRRPRLRSGRPRPRRRRRAELCRWAQGHGSLRPVGVTRRDRPRSPRPRCCRPRSAGACASKTCSAFVATPPPARRCSLPARPRPRRPPNAGDALRAPGDRRLRRRPGELDRPGDRGPRPIRRTLPARPHLRGRGRPHAGPRSRGSRRSRHRLSRT